MPMNWIETTLTKLEGSLRDIFEGEAGSDGIPRKLHRQLERSLFQAMKVAISTNSSQVQYSGEKLAAPDQYVLILPSPQAELLLKHPVELDRLAKKLIDSARQEGIDFSRSPILRVVASPQSDEIRIFAESNRQELGDSHTSQLEELLKGERDSPLTNVPLAYLIVNGLTTFPLTQPLINIGRDPANHLQLEDIRISRLHAQIRFIQGEFIIFDLDSKGGTFVNGVPVTSQVLKPGDVIQLAGVPLVYGQDAASRSDYTQELPADPPAPEVL
jgi:hypothetical protein